MELFNFCLKNKHGDEFEFECENGSVWIRDKDSPLFRTIIDSDPVKNKEEAKRIGEKFIASDIYYEK